MVKYPKHLLVIRDVKYDIGNEFIITEDIDTTYSTLFFGLPYVELDDFNTKNLKKYDRVQLYFNFFDSASARRSASISDMNKVFDGYIDRLELKEAKISGGIYNIFCKSTVGLAYERTALTELVLGNLTDIITNAIDAIGLNTFLPSTPDTTPANTGIPNSLTFNIDTNVSLGAIFDEMKEKYAIHIFQVGDGDLLFRSPFYLSTSSVIAQSYDLALNTFSIDYGEITAQVDTVVVIGSGGAIGIAFDPIGLQLKLGVEATNVVTDPQAVASTTNKNDFNPLYIFRRDVVSTEECQEIARNKLVELSRNYQITLDVEFDSNQKLGDAFTIKNSDKIPDTQLWIVKNRNITISKNDIKCTITAYSNSVSDLPDDLLLSDTGLLDTDILEVTDKVENTIHLHGS